MDNELFHILIEQFRVEDLKKIKHEEKRKWLATIYSKL
jgi:hypothetical protein